MRLIKTHLNKNHLDNRGFSIIELLLSIAILAIIVAPLLNNFVMATKVNEKAKRIQNETVFAQNIVEDLKVKSISDIAKEYNYPADFSITEQLSEVKWNGTEYVVVEAGERSSIKKLITNGAVIPEYEYIMAPEKTDSPYLFTKKNIEYCGKNYDALITIDGSAYNTLSLTKTYNTFQMPIIEDINTNKNALAVQSFETELAVATLYSEHLGYCINEQILHPTNPIITPNTPEDIRRTLKKQLNINITKTVINETQIKVDFIYSSSIIGCSSANYVVYNEKFDDPMGSVYVFYYPSDEDSITIIKDPSITEEIDVYMVKQAHGTDTSTLEKVVGGLYGIKLYSNVDYVNTSDVELIKKEAAKNRIFNIKVQLYPAGTNYSNDKLCVEFKSTKE